MRARGDDDVADDDYTHRRSVAGSAHLTRIRGFRVIWASADPPPTTTTTSWAPVAPTHRTAIMQLSRSRVQRASAKPTRAPLPPVALRFCAAPVSQGGFSFENNKERCVCCLLFVLFMRVQNGCFWIGLQVFFFHFLYMNTLLLLFCRCISRSECYY